MGQNNQYDADVKRLAELISKYTRIPKTRAAAYLKENGVSRLHQCSYSLVKTDEQFQKLASLFEFIRLYEGLADKEKGHVLTSTVSAREYFKNFYADKQDKEYFSAAFLDLNGGIIKTKVLSEGTVDTAPIYPREILKEALFTNSNSVILGHNHPGRTEKMSYSDIEATQEVFKRLNAADIILDDHILVAGQKTFSLAETGVSLGDKNRHFKVNERDLPRHDTVKSKASARGRLMLEKAGIAKESAERMKNVPAAKKASNLEI